VGEINREASNVGLGTSNSTNATNLSVYIGGGQTSTSGSAVNINLSQGKVDAAGLGLTGTSVAGASPVTIGNVSNGTIAVGATETFTVNTASGSATYGVTGQAGDTGASQLARLNSDLGNSGISASLDSSGNLAFSSPGAFSINTGTTAGLAGVSNHGVNTTAYNGSLAYDTGAASSYTVSQGGNTASISLLAGLTNDTSTLASINSTIQAAGITGVTAIADGSGTAGGFSLQSTSAFTSTLVNANGGAAAVGTVNAPVGGGGALDAINAVNSAVQALGKVQGVVGAGENDLNYAINLANSQITNFSSAESGIRDADVATEAANLTKAQVLEQASVAAMAQANSAPQVILSLLKG